MYGLVQGSIVMNRFTLRLCTWYVPEREVELQAIGSVLQYLIWYEYEFGAYYGLVWDGNVWYGIWHITVKQMLYMAWYGMVQGAGWYGYMQIGG